MLSELQVAKGPNITIILDCCHAGGALRSFRVDGSAICFQVIPPIRSDDAFEAADSNHAEVLTSQISPPSCGCQIFLPSYCLRHARIFNMLQSLNLRGRVWNTRFDGYDHERHFTPSGTLKMDRPIWITQTYCIATDGHCIIVVRYYSTKNGSNGIFGNFWELILFYVVSTSST